MHPMGNFFWEDVYQPTQHQRRNIIHTAMIQRTLFRQSRSLASCLRTSSNPSLSRSQFLSASRIAPSSLRPISTRWYSTEPEKKNAEDQKGESKESDAPAVDPAKKELEAKDKEIVDLKVCCQISTIKTLHPNRSRRINIYDKSPSSEIYKSGPSAICKLLEISPSKNSPRI